MLRVASRRARACQAAGIAIGAAALSGLATGASPAQALVAKWRDIESDYFAGAGCGSASSATSYLRLHARHIHVRAPKRGQLFRDIETGSIVARVADVDIGRNAEGRRFVRWTATGVGDACTNPAAYAEEGWATDDLRFDVSYSTRERVYFPARCSSPSYRPRTVVIACGDGNFQLKGMHWRGWNSRTAYGRGFAWVNDCEPFCAAGHFHYYPIRVRLTKPRSRTCGVRKRFLYRRVRIRYTGPRPAGARRVDSFPFGCLNF